MRAALLAALALAGCVAPEAPAATDEVTYRFIDVTTEHEAEPGDGSGFCGFPSTPEVDEERRTVTFHNEWPGRDLGVLVLVVAWDRTGCGTAATTWATAPLWAGALQAGGATFELREDGSLAVDGEAVPPGGEATLTRRGTFEDGRAWTTTMHVRDRGAWPLAGLRLAE